MSQVPTDCKYARTHEWVKVQGDVAIIGITDHAQDSLGDITFVELPAVGSSLQQGGEFGVVESVKAASDLYAPIGGTVSAVNEALQSEPEMVNKEAHGSGWLIKVKNFDAAQLNSLMDAAAYEAFMESEQ